MVRGNRRIVRLEACRGIAACIVVAGHLAMTFASEFVHRITGSVFFIAINGVAAVAFFFVLSGYVLSVRFFENPDPIYMAAAAIKRLPRLALLTTIVALTSAMLWMSGVYDSSDLVRFNPDFHPSLIGAFKEGAWRTFMIGDSYYVGVLWTMVHEFRGSLLVFVFSPFLVLVLKRRMVWFAFPFSVAIFHYADPFMIYFLCGIAIAYYQDALRRIPWLAPTTGILLAAAAFLLSYPPTAMIIVNGNVLPDQSQPTMVMLAWATGASCLIVGVLQSSVAERLLDNRIGAALGYLSFPIYLAHGPVLLSAGSLLYQATGDPVLASICTVVLTGVVSWPLAMVDTAWVRFLNTRIGQLLADNRSR